MAVVIPMPSLDLPSAATAPRCSRRASAVSAFSRMSCEGMLVRVATKPTPQDSCSKRGSTKEVWELSGRSEDRDKSEKVMQPMAYYTTSFDTLTLIKFSTDAARARIIKKCDGCDQENLSAAA